MNKIAVSPQLIRGGIHADGRGILRFCNDFDMSAVKRFYTIANSAEQPVRGWIGHKRETKWFFPMKGRTIVAVESFNHEIHEAHEKSVNEFELNADDPKVLKVPPGNWFYIEQHGGAEVMVFSDCKVGEFENDDFRRKL